MNASRYCEMNAVSQLGRATRLSLAVLLSAFGPYLSASVGLRLDHVVVYGLFVVSCVAMLADGHLVLKRLVWATLALWGGALVYMLTVTLLFGEASSSRAVIAAVETQTQPFALILILGLALRRLSGDECCNLAEVVSITIIAMMCINAVLALASVYMDTSGVISYFVTTNAVGASVSSSAASMGRYSGVFNQPAEAGVAYSVAVLGWVYLIIARGVRRWSLSFSLVLLVAGGLLTVSKLFVLGGLPLAIIYGLWVGISSAPSRMGRLTLWSGISIAAIMSLSGWAGWEYLIRLFGAAGMDPGGLLRMYSSGRYGQAGFSAQGLFERTMQEAPLRGFGLGSYAPLDSGYIEFLYQGGTVALLLYIGVLAVLLVHAVRSTALHLGEGRLQLMLLALILGGNFGISVLTANRASTILWVFLLVLTHASLQAALEQRQLSLGFRVTTVAGGPVTHLNNEDVGVVASAPVGKPERIDLI